MVLENHKLKKSSLETWQPITQVVGEDLRTKGRCTEGTTTMQKTDLTSGWQMEFVPYAVVSGEGGCTISDTIQTDTLFDLKDTEAYQHFAGTIVYRKTFEAQPQATTLLNLGTVEGVTEVLVNGQSAGVRYFGRRIYDLSDLVAEGENSLEIRVTTTLGNWMKTFSREENLPAWVYLNNRNHTQELQPQGMLGPVSLYR